MDRILLTIYRPRLLSGMMILGISLSLPWGMSYAEDTRSNTDEHSSGIVSLLDTPRNYLSDNLLDFSDLIDQIFSNTENYATNNSYARFSTAVVYLDTDPPYPLTDSYIFIALPRTQNKLTLLFQTDTSAETDTGGPDLQPGSPSQKSNALVLRGQIERGNNWSIKADIGTKFTTVLDPFIRINYQLKIPFKSWSLLWRESLYRYAYQGNGIDSQVRADYPINEQFHLRLDNQISWLEQNTYIDRSHRLGLYQKLDKQTALSYSIGSYTTTDPMDSIYYAQIRYKRLLHKTWLYYEIIPEYIYPQSTNFTATPKLTLKLEMLLGNP